MFTLMSPKIDYAFKELMQNDKVREKFIGATLKIDEKDIKDSILINTILRKRHKEDKYGILDVRVKLKDDTEINIEVQLARLSIWPDRSLYYISKMLTETVHESDSYDQLKKCVAINILDFNLWEDESFYHTSFQLFEKDRHFLYSNKMEFHIIELRKVPKVTIESDPLYWWVRFLNANTKEEFEMLAKKHADIDEAYEQLRKVSADEIKRVEYTSREKAIRDSIAMKKENDREREEIEQEREEVEQERVEVEQIRLENEKIKLENERERLENEKTKLENEKTKLENEKERKKLSEMRKEMESFIKEVIKTKADLETMKTEVEEIKKNRF